MDGDEAYLCIYLSVVCRLSPVFCRLSDPPDKLDPGWRYAIPFPFPFLCRENTASSPQPQPLPDVIAAEAYLPREADSVVTQTLHIVHPHPCILAI